MVNKEGVQEYGLVIYEQLVVRVWKARLKY